MNQIKNKRNEEQVLKFSYCERIMIYLRFYSYV